MAAPPPYGKNPNKWNPPLPPQLETPPQQQHAHHHHAKKPTKNQRKIHSEPPSKPIGSWSPRLHQRCLHNHGPKQDQYPAITTAPCRHYNTTTQNPLPQIKTPQPHHHGNNTPTATMQRNPQKIKEKSISTGELYHKFSLPHPVWAQPQILLTTTPEARIAGVRHSPSRLR